MRGVKQNMKLQILVPQYKETDEIVKPLLDSIAIQQNVDFDEIEVIICNDGTDVHLSQELLNGYPFEIKYHLEPHRGVSGTRNACLDYATAEYVMFCTTCAPWRILPVDPRAMSGLGRTCIRRATAPLV